MPMETTGTRVNEINAAIQLLKAVADTVKEVKEAPSGAIYAALMGVGVSLATYQACVETLKRTKLITESNHVLKWVGPN